MFSFRSSASACALLLCGKLIHFQHASKKNTALFIYRNMLSVYQVSDKSIDRSRTFNIQQQPKLGSKRIVQLGAQYVRLFWQANE